MRFPGQRIAKHYFPVTDKTTQAEPVRPRSWCLVGLDQVLVDMEVQAPASFVREVGLRPGESVQLTEEEHRALLQQIGDSGFACRFASGGTVANTLNNYVHLSNEPAVLLGAIPDVIRPGEAAFHYVAQTPQTVSLEHLVPVAGSVGTAITFVFPDGDRSFAVAPGISNEYPAAEVKDDVITAAATVLVSLYSLGDPAWPIARATLRAMSLADEAGIPVAFGLGTANLVSRMRDEVRQLLRRYVTIAAMNDREATALTGEDDALLACEQVLDWTDLAIVTQGAEGMTIGGYVDRQYRRQTRQAIRSKAIPEYNRWEYSRLMRRADCSEPLKIFTHIHPYRGGPDRLTNCSGAGDAALAAILHDVAANQYHRAKVPDSEKHVGGRFLTYSSLSRNAQYGNRVAYEVLKGASPRLRGAVGPDRSS